MAAGKLRKPRSARVRGATGIRNHKGVQMKEKLSLLLERLHDLVREQEGQDLVEYALLAGFVAVAAGALLPSISGSISVIFSKMASVLSAAAA